ncbi:hypothetical protein WFZ85_14935 [Flavobacterium sp. j3]|uniref:Uncharacterized protein n=1 Tax=Flavobacterium aureirubrum TaxID=3133147 RepID=A0ABU9N9A4_9FLAO
MPIIARKIENKIINKSGGDNIPFSTAGFSKTTVQNETNLLKREKSNRKTIPKLIVIRIDIGNITFFLYVYKTIRNKKNIEKTNVPKCVSPIKIKKAIDKKMLTFFRLIWKDR